MEAADVFVRSGQAAVEQLAAAQNLHAQAARADEGQHRLRNQAGALPDGFCLVRAVQVVHLEQHQPVVSQHFLTFSPVQYLRRETNPRQSLCGLRLCRVHVAQPLLHLRQRIFLTDFPACPAKDLSPDVTYYCRELVQLERLLVPILPDDCYFHNVLNLLLSSSIFFYLPLSSFVFLYLPLSSFVFLYLPLSSSIFFCLLLSSSIFLYLLLSASFRCKDTKIFQDIQVFRKILSRKFFNLYLHTYINDVNTLSFKRVTLCRLPTFLKAFRHFTDFDLKHH